MSYDGRQIERERHEYQLAQAKLTRNEERQLARGGLPGKLESAVMRKLWGRYVQHVEEWLVRMSSGPGRNSQAAPWIAKAGAEHAAGVALGIIARGLLRRVAVTTVAQSIGDRIRDEILWRECQAANATAAAKTARNPARAGGLGKRLPILAKSLGVEVNIPRKDRIRMGVTLIELLRLATGAVEIVKAMSPRRKQGWRSMSVVSVHPDFEVWLARFLASPEVRATHGPMIAPPKPWSNEVGGGRHLNEYGALVRGGFRRDLEAGPRMRAVANHLQSVAWRINPDSYWTLRRVWEETGRPVGHLPLREDMPVPEWKDEASVEYRTGRAAVVHQNRSARSRRLAVLYALRACEQLSSDGGTDLWFPVQYDYRGRVYYDVSYLSPQGNDLERGLLRFAGPPRPLDEEARGALLIHLANLAGHDKLTYPERIEWAEAQRPQLEALTEDPVGQLSLWEGADEPWQYLAAAFAVVRDDDGSLPIFSDGTCNGLQVFSLLLRDRATAARVNVTAPASPDERPRDVYAEVARRSAELLPQAGPDGARLADWLGGELPRRLVKRTVMTLPYGVTPETSRMYLHEHLEEKIREGRTWPGSKDEFKNATRVLGRVVWDVVGELLPAAMLCRDWLATAAKSVGDEFYWETPLGMRVYLAPERTKRSRLTTSVYGRRLSAAMRVGTGKVNVQKQASSMAPNFVHSLDAACLHLAAERTIEAGHAWAGVHDCVGTRAGSYAFVGRAIRQAYADVFTADLLEDLARQLRDRYDVSVPDPPERGDLNPEEILRSPYAFN